MKVMKVMNAKLLRERPPPRMLSCLVCPTRRLCGHWHCGPGPAAPTETERLKHRRGWRGSTNPGPGLVVRNGGGEGGGEELGPGAAGGLLAAH